MLTVDSVIISSSNCSINGYENMNGLAFLLCKPFPWPVSDRWQEIRGLLCEGIDSPVCDGCALFICKFGTVGYYTAPPYTHPHPHTYTQTLDYIRAGTQQLNDSKPDKKQLQRGPTKCPNKSAGSRAPLKSSVGFNVCLWSAASSVGNTVSCSRLRKHFDGLQCTQ